MLAPGFTFFKCNIQTVHAGMCRVCRLRDPPHHILVRVRVIYVFTTEWYWVSAWWEVGGMWRNKQCQGLHVLGVSCELPW